MEKLYELAILTAKHKDVLKVLLPDKEGSPLRKLFDLVYLGNQMVEDECMLKIYKRRNLSAFSRLKSRLREIMYCSLILHTNILDDGDGLSNVALSNLRNLLIFRVLISKRSYLQAGELIEKTISTSLKYGFTENILLQCRQLIIYNSSFRINKYKFDKYSELQTKYLNIYNWEIKAETFFLDLQSTNIQSLANPSEDLVKKARSYVEELNSANGIQTQIFSYNKYRVLATYYEYSKDFESLLHITEKAIKEFSSPTYNTPFIVSNLYIRKIWALIQSGNSKTAITFGLNVIENLRPGPNVLYRISHYTIKAFFYNKEYLNGIKLLCTIMNDGHYNKVDLYYKEIYGIALGYSYLLIESKTISLHNNQNKLQLPEFKLGKFLNTSPHFSKDKRGINVSILLMHIAFLLQRKEYNAIIDRTDSLNQYAYRYLRKDDSFRSNCMIKMVIQMTKADFHPVRTERYTADLLRQLSTVNLAGSGENIEIEIIPFEVLWEIMVKSL